MNPPCARCKKIVYPVEKLTCLDKVKIARRGPFVFLLLGAVGLLVGLVL